MIFEIHGAGFKNKGSEMMLRTVISELKCRFPTLKLAIDTSYGSYSQRCSLDLLQIIPSRCHVGKSGFNKRFQWQKKFSKYKGYKILSLILRVSFKQYGMIDLEQINGFFDISGFAYSDQWGLHPTRDLAKIVFYYKQRNKPVILFPQAFGPFENPAIRAAFIDAIKYIDLIFARDELSLKYLTELFDSGSIDHSMKLNLAPDLTFFYNTKINKPLNIPGKYVCIIPNIRVIDKGEVDWQEKYEHYIFSIVSFFISNNIPVYIIIHDSNGGDMDIAKKVTGKMTETENIVIFNNDNPLYLKYLISRSFIVVGSRYHGLIAALSSGVPSVCIGWSHKYTMLFRDFECEHFVFTAQDTIDIIIEHLKELLSPEINCFYRERINQKMQSLRERNEMMWQLVENVVYRYSDKRCQI